MFVHLLQKYSNIVAVFIQNIVSDRQFGKLKIISSTFFSIIYVDKFGKQILKKLSKFLYKFV